MLHILILCLGVPFGKNVLSPKHRKMCSNIESRVFRALTIGALFYFVKFKFIGGEL